MKRKDVEKGKTKILCSICFTQEVMLFTGYFKKCNRSRLATGYRTYLGAKNIRVVRRVNKA